MFFAAWGATVPCIGASVCGRFGMSELVFRAGSPVREALPNEVWVRRQKPAKVHSLGQERASLSVRKGASQRESTFKENWRGLA